MAKVNLDKLVAQLNRLDDRPGWLNSSWPAACELWKLGEAGKQPLVDAIDHENQNTRMSASIAIGWYGPEMGEIAGKKLVRELFRKWESSTDQFRQRHVAWALRRLFPDIGWVLGEIRDGLKSKDKQIRIQAAASLYSFEMHQIPIQGDLIRLLDDRDYDVREAALDAMEDVGVRDPEHVNRLLKAMDESGLAQTAGRVFGESGKYARPRVPDLIKKIARSEDQESRTHLFHALTRWKEYDTHLLDSIRDIPAGIRFDFQAFDYLADCGFGDADYYRPYAEKCLKTLSNDKQTNDWARAVSSLLRLAKYESLWGRQARDILQKSLQSKKIPVRIEAICALRKDLDESDGKTLLTGDEPEILTKMFGAENNPKFRVMVARLCSEMAADVTNLLPEIAAQAGDKNESISLRSIETMGDIGVTTKDVTAAIEGVLKNLKSKPNAKLAAVCAIRDLGHGAESMAPLLLDACGKGGASQDACYYRERAVEGLIAIGYNDPAGIPVVEKLLNDSWPHTRFPAAALMHRIDPSHKFGQRVLLAGLGSDESSHRAVVFDALIENPSLDTLPVDTLRDRLYDSLPTQRMRAFGVLSALKIQSRLLQSDFEFMEKYETNQEILQILSGYDG